MAKEYSVKVCKELKGRFYRLALHRPMRVSRYDAGDELSYEVTGVESADKAKIQLVIEDFVGGGYAGQVYKVRLTKIENSDGDIKQLQVDKQYAMKILLPPRGFARFFRNILYRIGFQGPFQPQVNPTAARAEALWQKFIRRAAKVRFGDEKAVVDIYATFVDEKLGSCGELSEWIDGRTWRLEVDDRLDFLKQYLKGKDIDTQKLGSAEYLAKRKFMSDFTELLDDLGAYEFARQYEWSTCKSQPNCLKRLDTETEPQKGLVAVDCRAGLTLLPFLPMSPGDFKLIAKGIARGSMVQFDRGDLNKLQRFIDEHSEDFADMKDLFDELKSSEKIYRDSIIDITHNHLRLFYSGSLWHTISESTVTGWSVRNFIDGQWDTKFRENKFLYLLFLITGIIPFLGKIIRRIWARVDWRKHYAEMLSSFQYLARAVKGRIIEKAICWHRAGRVSAERAQKIAQHTSRFLLHLPFSILPSGLHRFLTDAEFFKEKLHYIFVRPVKLYFSRQLREQWLREMVEEGKKKHILTDQDAETIISQLGERYIQRYLVSVVVHFMTLPLTQIVSIIVAWIVYQHTGSELGAGGVLVLFQIIPVSPGSFARGLYAVGLAIYDRNFKEYNIAVFLSFAKYIGYLAFPIQMAYRYPALSRFMSAHWATDFVHIVPVFGERGALLEHWVFNLFYNWPLTIRRRMKKRAQLRAQLKPRYWHSILCSLALAFIFIFIDWLYLERASRLASLRAFWLPVILAPLLCGGITTLGCKGAVLWKRILTSTMVGCTAGVLYWLGSNLLIQNTQLHLGVKRFIYAAFMWAILSTIGAILAELKQPDPELLR
jgi:hypothetical protein